MDESQFRFIVQLPVGTRLEESVQVAARMEKIIQETIGKETKAIQVNFGHAHGHGLGHLFAEHRARIWAGSGPGWSTPGERTLSSDALMEKLRPKLLQEFPGVRIFFSLRGDRAHADLLREREPDRRGDPRI